VARFTAETRVEEMLIEHDQITGLGLEDIARQLLCRLTGSS
jgi:hypothetical protein